MRFFRYGVILILLSLFANCAWAAIDSGLDEYQVKAVYLYKFATYVEWPSSVITDAEMPITIGIIGSDKVFVALDNLLSNQSMADKKIKVKLLKPNDSLVGVQIFFIGRDQNDNVIPLLKNTKFQPILTVTDFDNALSFGSVINFISVGDHIRFEVSMPHAERNGLKISVRLLAVAQRIETGRPL